MVEIDTLNWEIMKDIDVVYDVHLSEGRSYHANGYLTSVSYPEVRSRKTSGGNMLAGTKHKIHNRFL